MKLAEVPSVLADYTVGTLIVITYLTSAEKRADRLEQRRGKAKSDSDHTETARDRADKTHN